MRGAGGGGAVHAYKYAKTFMDAHGAWHIEESRKTRFTRHAVAVLISLRHTVSACAHSLASSAPSASPPSSSLLRVLRRRCLCLLGVEASERESSAS